MSPYSLDHISLRSYELSTRRIGLLSMRRALALLPSLRVALHRLLGAARVRVLLSPSLVMSKNVFGRTTTRSSRFVEIMGLEPTTYGLQSRRSSQLSYIPSYVLVSQKKGKG
jgi:hypothetical protein